MIRARVLLFSMTATLTLHSSIAHAQLETFAQTIRELAAASLQTGPSRSANILAAADRMKPALVEWDRGIGDLRARADRELPTATAERAYQLHVELGVAYRRRGRTAEALREFDLAAGIRASSDLQVLRALSFEAAGRLDEAGQAYRTAWSLDANNPVKAYYAAQRGSAAGADRDRARAILADMYRNRTFEAG